MTTPKKNWEDISSQDKKLVERILNLDCLMGIGYMVDDFFEPLFDQSESENKIVIVTNLETPLLEAPTPELQTFQEICFTNGFSLAGSRFKSDTICPQLFGSNSHNLVLVNEFTKEDIKNKTLGDPERLGTALGDLVKDLGIRKPKKLEIFYYWNKDVIIDSMGLIYSEIKLQDRYEHFEEFGEHEN